MRQQFDSCTSDATHPSRNYTLLFLEKFNVDIRQNNAFSVYVIPVLTLLLPNTF